MRKDEEQRVRGPGKGDRSAGVHSGSGWGLHIKVVSGGERLRNALPEGIVHSAKGVCVCVF